MRQAHEVAKVRAAEGALMATLPEGALMQRAAFGLASVCAGLLEQPYGARAVVLAGSGDNGGGAADRRAPVCRRGGRGGGGAGAGSHMGRWRGRPRARGRSWWPPTCRAVSTPTAAWSTA